METFEDNSGGTHFRLHEHLELGSEGEIGAEGNAEAKVRWCRVALRLVWVFVNFILLFFFLSGIIGAPLVTTELCTVNTVDIPC